jgi:hypothetical protein
MAWAKRPELEIFAVVGERRLSYFASCGSWLFGQTAGDVKFEL